MKKLISSGAAFALTLAAVALPTVSASAATYISKLEYRDGLVGPQTPYGQVKLEELADGKSVKVTVTLTNANSLFINTGGPHDPFLYNTVVDDTATILAPIDSFVDGGRGSFNSTPFGYFTDKIACCNNQNGASHGDAPPLIFTVFNPLGLTFAGLGATFNPSGKLLTTGTGDRFKSNAGGWWFAADIYDGATGLTYNVVARDAFIQQVQTAVPEPSSWALMILGFGGVGAMLRSRRKPVLA